VFLNGIRVKQEDFASEESVFPPLVGVHERVKELDHWIRFREELERLIKDLEDLLDSPAVRTAAANRARFPKPGEAEVTGRSCLRCGQENSLAAKFCFNCGATLPAAITSEGGTSFGQRQVAPRDRQGNPELWILLSVAFAFVALFLFPPVFGGLGVYFAYRAKQTGSEAGGVAMMVVSGACLLLGMFWGSLTWGL
jgi:hypothetical protein